MLCLTVIWIKVKQNELIWVTLFKHSQAAAISILITTLEIHIFGACLFEQFTAQWLLYVTGGLPFDKCTLCVRTAFMSCVFFSQQRGITSLYSRKGMDFTTETECVSCTAWFRSLNINQVNVIKEVGSSGAWRLVLGKMDTNISVESLLQVIRWKRGWMEQVTFNCRMSQQERQFGIFFHFFKSF